MPLPRIAVTMGDPAGIGPELCLRLLDEPSIRTQCVPVVVGDAGLLRRAARHSRLAEPARIIPADQWGSTWQHLNEPAVWDLQTMLPAAVQPGCVNAATARASVQYIEAAIAAAMAHQVDALVTGPIHKEAWNTAAVGFPGHTELLAARTRATRYCMMLTSREITCSLVTTHVGYRDVPRLLSTERIVDVIRLSHDAMLRMRDHPLRLAVCGLNPHAGEHGLFGEGEEERIIAPAIDIARQQGIQIQGPLPPDTAFVAARRRQTDCYICMYHDQGLIPLKSLAFDAGVNVTLGLPIIRTSVDHGTALDIAWQGKADWTSMAEAVKLAARLAAGQESRGVPPRAERD